MKKYLTILFAAIIMTSCGQTTNKVNSDLDKKQDTLKEVTTVGVFDGIIINKYGYMINEYCIAITDITATQLDSLKGKKVMIKGKLKIVEGNSSGNIQSTLDDKKYITEPQFTIVYD